MSGGGVTVIQPIHCGRCGRKIDADKSPDGGWIPRGKQFVEWLPDGRIRRSRALTCEPCIDAFPDQRPEMGEPFDPRRVETEAVVKP